MNIDGYRMRIYVLGTNQESNFQLLIRLKIRTSSSRKVKDTWVRLLIHISDFTAVCCTMQVCIERNLQILLCCISSYKLMTQPDGSNYKPH